MWKDIIGWEKYYEINEHGDVRNKLTKHLVIGDKNSIGYMRVCLYNKNHNPKKQRFFRHRLVATYFIQNPYNLPEVNHLDTDITNNDVSNLEWVTRNENEQHSRLLGHKPYKPFVVTKEDGNKIKYDNRISLAKELNTSRQTIKNWLKGRSKGYKNYGITSIQYVDSSHIYTNNNQKGM